MKTTTAFENLGATGLSASLFLLLAAPLSADYATGFEPGHDSGYQIGQTIIGVDGWEVWTLHSENPLDARIVPALDGGDGQVLFMESTSTGNANNRRTRVVRAFAPPQDDLVHVNVDLAFDWGAERVSWMGMQVNPWEEFPTVVAFASDVNYGLFYLDDGLPVVVLPPAEVKRQSPYHVSLLLDTSTQTFSIRIDGLRADGSPLSYSADNRIFRRETEETPDITEIKDIRFKIGQGGGGGAHQMWIDNLIVGPGPLVTETPAPGAGNFAAVELVFPTDNDRFYQITTSTDLVSWGDAGGMIAGDGDDVRRFFSTQDQSRQFFRVLTGN